MHCGIRPRRPGDHRPAAPVSRPAGARRGRRRRGALAASCARRMACSGRARSLGRHTGHAGAGAAPGPRRAAAAGTGGAAAAPHGRGLATGAGRRRAGRSLRPGHAGAAAGAGGRAAGRPPRPLGRRAGRREHGALLDADGRHRRRRLALGRCRTRPRPAGLGGTQRPKARPQRAARHRHLGGAGHAGLERRAPGSRPGNGVRSAARCAASAVAAASGGGAAAGLAPRERAPLALCGAGRPRQPGRP